MAEPLWTSAEIAAASGGRLAGQAFAAAGVSIDSRSLRGGELFVALAGERDGHRFVEAAFAAGAAGAMTSHAVDGPCVVVDDTLKGLARLGLAARGRTAARIGAVTGSVGKTGVTQAVLAALRLAGDGHGSIQSYNNHIGVPLTLARMPRETRRAIFEIGMNHAGEIAPLSVLVRPHAVAITTVAAVHTENFADGEAGVAAAKAEVFAGLERGGLAILNADCRWFDFLAGEAARAGAEVRAFGARADAAARLTGFQVTEAGTRIQARIDGRPIDFVIPQTGAHWGAMSLCALLMIRALDVDIQTALAALAEFRPLEGRGEESRVRLARGGFTLIDESYNANPLSMRAALASLGGRSAAGRRIAVLTDMLELGASARRDHAALAQAIEEAGVDRVFCAGPLMAELWSALPASARGGWAESAEALLPQVRSAIGPGDVVMVKGSKASRAHALAAELKAPDRSGRAA
ncbi:MAG: UDP-N-acetylmuramoyl-tripeptide--D-alanyl-D-alanine ligase [Caulobacteraceae bacterium]